MKTDLHKKGKELIAMGESLCAMAEDGDSKESTEESSEDEPMSGDSGDKKKMAIAMLSKKFGKASEY